MPPCEWLSPPSAVASGASARRRRSQALRAPRRRGSWPPARLAADADPPEQGREEVLAPRSVPRHWRDRTGREGRARHSRRQSRRTASPATALVGAGDLVEQPERRGCAAMRVWPLGPPPLLPRATSGKPSLCWLRVRPVVVWLRMWPPLRNRTSWRKRRAPSNFLVGEGARPSIVSGVRSGAPQHTSAAPRRAAQKREVKNRVLAVKDRAVRE